MIDRIIERERQILKENKKIMALKLETRVQRTAKKLLKLFGPNGEHWVKGDAAIDANGDAVEIKSRKATKWCLSGAFEKLNVPSTVTAALSEKLLKAGHSTNVVDFNDSKRTYTHVRKFLEKVEKAKI